jgi:hypothetical protein
VAVWPGRRRPELPIVVLVWLDAMVNGGVGPGPVFFFLKVIFLLIWITNRFLFF